MAKSRSSAILILAAFAAAATLYLNSFTSVRNGTTRASAPAAAAWAELSPTRYLENVRYLSSDQMKGRGDGTPELDKAADYIAAQFRLWGLRPMGDNGTYFQSFEITTGAVIGPNNELELNGESLKLNQDFAPIMFSTSGDVDAPVMFAGYGVTAPELNYDDYHDVDANGKIVVVIRQAQDSKSAAHFNRHTFLIDKAIAAKQHGAKAIVFINDSDHTDQDLSASRRTDETADLGIPAVYVKRDPVLAVFKTAGKDLGALEKKIDSDMKPQSFDGPAAAHVHVVTDIVRTRKTVRNVAGAITGSDAGLQNEWVVVGAHYDHLGLGDQNSLAPSQIGQIHHGADDNASGTAGVLELARLAAKNKDKWKRSVLFITF